MSRELSQRLGQELSPELAAIAEEISAWFADRFTHLETLAAEMIAALRFDAQRQLELTESTRRRMKAVAVRALAEHPVLDGCGFIFARAALGTENGHLEWWVREDEARFARYSFGVVPGGDRYYDYEHHEWFIRAFHHGVPALVGPYVDYLGVEAYVITLTVPAAQGDTRLGAVGTDIQVSDLEAELLPVLLRSSETLALVGRHGNVILGNSSRFMPGEFVPAELPGAERVALGPESAGVSLLVAAAGTP
ncbi:cache domain-containing protein [Leucobacter chromiireducens]|uniref:cache domain-containing protein n=1 Tax=Leucobacter chromiireducens TaxID=283877 RepID=UPI000F62FD74|nr:cache domain-containing protein [Leucobacter chromiireducens]